MTLSKRDRYLATKVRLGTKSIERIFAKQRGELVRFLESFEERGFTKAPESLARQLTMLFEGWKEDVPSYLLTVLPTIMTTGSKPTIAKYKSKLPQGYALAFDLPTAPAVLYLDKLKQLHLSERDGSITKTTNDDVRKLIREGVRDGLSYGAIARSIQELDPFVFSKSRANLIATQEMGNAYGWANHEPAIEMERQGYLLEKKWQTKHDGKVRATHRENESQGWIPLNTPFSGTGDDYAPSSRNFRCRCVSTTRIVGISKEGKCYYYADMRWCMTRKFRGGDVTAIYSPANGKTHEFDLSA